MYRLTSNQKRKLNKLYERIDSSPINLSIKGSTSKEPISFDQRENSKFQSFNVGESWGELFDCAWFQLQGNIPSEILQKELYLKIDFNCELCLFNESGVPIKGFTNKSSEFDKSLGMPTKRYFKINDYIDPDGNVNLWIEAGLNDLFGKIQNKGKIKCVQILERNNDIRTLYFDLETLLPIYPKKADEILETFLNGGKIKQALEKTSLLLKKTTSNQHLISSIGHAHIDLAWLWPIRETKRKAARTFSNVLYLMEQYPDFKFGSSQPQLYEWVKEDYPKLYELIKQKIKEGRWEVQGGMWVESDTNVPSGESLVRQMLYGVRYFQKEFGIRVKNLWLPDVFGYSGSLPQIIKKSGLDYFMTIKLSWNKDNIFPHHTFHWKGIDGTSILAHMPPEGTYNSPINAEYAFKSQFNYQEKYICNRTLNVFGIGDGGGGPGAEHLERLQRIGDLEPLPRVKQEFSSVFFDNIASEGKKYPSYQGELYLENHRGTYTSQARNKYYNRKLEQKLKTIETMLVHQKKHSLFKKELEKIWKEILLYQFHDILPGSSIKRVYDESIDRYKKIDKHLEKILEKSLGTHLVDKEITKNCCVYNPLEREVKTYRRFEDKFIDFSVLPLSDMIKSLNVYQINPTGSKGVLENKFLRIKLNSDGSLSSVYDKEIQQEFLRKSANVLKIYRDNGNAWNIKPRYWWWRGKKARLTKRKHYRCESIEYIEQHYRYKDSTIIQKIILHQDEKIIEFDTELDWKDSHRMLRTAFPLNLVTDQAIFDIQFGNLSRTTRNKTKMEKARWEVSAQKWVDLSNGKYGGSMITESKYGYRIHKNSIDLNLLRSTVHPGKKGDIAKHRFRYAFYVHSGDHNQGKVDWKATVFNTWFPIYEKSRLNEPLLSISEENIQYSTIKTAEEGDSIIIRLYESAGISTSCIIKLKEFGECDIKETNLIEENEKLLNTGKEINLKFAPFEIKTLKIAPN